MNIYQGYNAYITYLALKQHFTTNYDFIKYNGKVKANQDSFLKRRDKFFFAKLEKRYKKDELIYFFVSNFVDHDNVWAGNLVSDHSESVYNEWKKRIQSLAYNFKQQCEMLADYDFNGLFEVKEYQHPQLLRMYMQKNIHPETMIIIDSCVGYLKIWNKEIDDDLIWPKQKLLLDKYKPFMSFDKDKYKKIMKNVFINR